MSKLLELFKALQDKVEVKDIINKIPVVNLLPIFGDMVALVPEAWDGLDEEKKKEIVTSLILAGAKAAKNYAEKP